MFPEKLDEDEEFEYYEIRVPRHYIRGHIEEGGVWLDYTETDEEGTEDPSVVLGVIYLPAFKGVEYLREDADFLYYKIRVPIIFLDTQVKNTPFKYREVFEAKRLNAFVDEDDVDGFAELIRGELPDAGSPMPGMHNEHIVKKVKEKEALLFEIKLVCKACDMVAVEVGSDLFDILSSRICANCGGMGFHLDRANIIYEDDDEEKRDLT